MGLQALVDDLSQGKVIDNGLSRFAQVLVYPLGCLQGICPIDGTGLERMFYHWHGIARQDRQLATALVQLLQQIVGQREIAEKLAANEVPESLVSGRSPELDAFLQRREAYLLYP